MTKLHKDIAMHMMECVQSQDYTDSAAVKVRASVIAHLSYLTQFILYHYRRCPKRQRSWSTMWRGWPLRGVKFPWTSFTSGRWTLLQKLSSSPSPVLRDLQSSESVAPCLGVFSYFTAMAVCVYIHRSVILVEVNCAYFKFYIHDIIFWVVHAINTRRRDTHALYT